MNVIAGGPGDQDPLARMGGVLLAVTLSFVASVLLAAVLASFVHGTYGTRVAIYLLLIVWNLIGAIALFRMTFQGESGRFELRRLPTWMLSIWLWPLLWLGRKKR